MKRMLELLLGGLLILPVGAVLLFSLSPSTAMDVYHRWPPSARWWEMLASDPRWPTAFATSATVGLLSAVVGLAVALPAVLFWRLTANRVAGRLLFLAGVPVCLPPVVLAVGMYEGISTIGLFDTIAGLSLAHVAFTTAVSVFVLSGRFQSESLVLYSTARGLGASPFRAAVTWLVATQGATLIGAIAAGMLISMSEVTVTIYVTDTKVVTVSRMVLSGISRDVNPTGFAAMAVWIAALIFLLAWTRARLWRPRWRTAMSRSG